MENKTNDILARLMAGESAEAIAQEFTDAINAAQAEYSAKTAAAESKILKTRMAQDIADRVNEYYKTFAADVLDDLGVIDADGIIMALDGVKDMAIMFAPIIKKCEKTHTVKPVAPDELDEILSLLTNPLGYKH